MAVPVPRIQFRTARDSVRTPPELRMVTTGTGVAALGWLSSWAQGWIGRRNYLQPAPRPFAGRRRAVPSVMVVEWCSTLDHCVNVRSFFSSGAACAKPRSARAGSIRLPTSQEPDDCRAPLRRGSSLRWSRFPSVVSDSATTDYLPATIQPNLGVSPHRPWWTVWAGVSRAVAEDCQVIRWSASDEGEFRPSDVDRRSNVRAFHRIG